MRYSLRQLEVFLAVAAGESVSRAARVLGMSQSAVSGSLAELERQFDIALFDRVGKRLRLNELGRSLRPSVEAVVSQANELEQRLGSKSESGALRVGATLTVGNYLTAPLIAEFLRDDPSAKVSLKLENTAEIARAVLNFELDVALVEGELQDSELEVSAFREDELVVFCAPEHPFARRRSLSDADLSSARWIVREPGSGTRQAFDHAMHGLLPELDIAFELQETEAIKSAVKAGLGVGCISRIALDEPFRLKSLMPCRVPHRDFRRQFYSVVHRQKHRSRAIRRWLTLCERRRRAAP
ncbi:MAG TPA: LysR family transcriptional regulator [Polyangiaceae bacterium]|nr:LysR family transcriptional regulator [Polyangiaceae bacterium]